MLAACQPFTEMFFHFWSSSKFHAEDIAPHFLQEETEAQGDQVTYSKWHGLVAGRGQEPNPKFCPQSLVLLQFILYQAGALLREQADASIKIFQGERSKPRLSSMNWDKVIQVEFELNFKTELKMTKLWLWTTAGSAKSSCRSFPIMKFGRCFSSIPT